MFPPKRLVDICIFNVFSRQDAAALRALVSSLQRSAGHTGGISPRSNSVPQGEIPIAIINNHCVHVNKL